jgi:hypothetical protein
VCFANRDPNLIAIFVAWLRRFFDVDESKWRIKLYLHEGLDLESAIAFWSALTGIPPSQFHKPYRALADPTRRKSKHVMGCPGVSYISASMFRRVMGIVSAVSSREVIPG